MENEILLKIDNLTKNFNNEIALKNINIEIKKRRSSSSYWF